MSGVYGRDTPIKQKFKKGETKELFNLDMPKHGWERFGENHTDTVLGGYIEGPWLTKHNGSMPPPARNSTYMPMVFMWPIIRWGLILTKSIIRCPTNRVVI